MSQSLIILCVRGNLIDILDTVADINIGLRPAKFDFLGFLDDDLSLGSKNIIVTKQPN